MRGQRPSLRRTTRIDLRRVNQVNYWVSTSQVRFKQLCTDQQDQVHRTPLVSSAHKSKDPDVPNKISMARSRVKQRPLLNQEVELPFGKINFALSV